MADSLNSTQPNEEVKDLRLQVARLQQTLEEERRLFERLRSRNLETGLPVRRILDKQLARALAVAGNSDLAILLVRLQVTFRSTDAALSFQRGREFFLHEIGQRILLSREGEIFPGDEVLLASEEYDMSPELQEQHGVRFLQPSQAALFQGDLAEDFVVAVKQPRSRSWLTELVGAIIRQIGLPFPEQAAEIRFGCTIGAVTAPHDSADPLQIIRFAELALSEANSRQKHYMFFRPEFRDRADRRREIERELRADIQAGFRGFSLVFQPIVDAQRRIIGAESLIRWSRRDGTTISPAVFIPVAEEMGLIQQLGVWTLYSASRAMVGWEAENGPTGRKLRQLSVNVSAVQFAQEDLPERVNDLVRAAGLSPERMKLEVTETAAMSDPDASLATMQQIRDRGFRISIDDFGTGYSSLAYLQRFPIDQLKIDRSLVQHVHQPDADRDRGIVRGIVAICQNLGGGISSLAEGVESAEQVRTLLDLGIGELQGYHLSRPVPAAELGKLLAEDIQLPARGS